MGGGLGARWRALSLAAALLTLVAGGNDARAFEAFDGRLQLHGFAEIQLRTMSDNFSTSNGFDLTQWYNILNLELEYDIAPDGFLFFDLMSAYVRAEFRFDCVWTHACGIFPSASAFGDRTGRLPGVRVDGKRGGLNGSQFTGDLYSGPQLYDSSVGTYTGTILQPVTDPRTGLPRGIRVRQDGRIPAKPQQLPGLSGLFPVRGVDQIFDTPDDPAFFYFSRQQADCIFGVRRVPGGINGEGTQILPHNPRCPIKEKGILKRKPNPFNDQDFNPILSLTPSGQPNPNPFGSGELPARPASLLLATDRPRDTDAQGVYYPNPAFQRVLRSGELNDPLQNFSQEELQWNRGASQQQTTYELKEAYLDIELFDSRLWLRLGKQNIVWGKTELFRTTDQFNPQDLALSSLPSLEESRIALNAFRAVWSFWDVGPLNDVRLEGAVNFDTFVGADTGRCGEPYTAFAACNRTLGLWGHGITATGLAGEARPANPWNDINGLEGGARLEFRWDRFSFQLSDFYGYEDFPYVDRIFSYERNVDPVTGRPRRAGAVGGCGRTGSGNDPSCLPLASNADDQGNVPAGLGVTDPAGRPDSLASVATNMHIFAMICATSIGFNSVDASSCGQSIFNSLISVLTQAPPPVPRGFDPAGDAKTVPTVAALLSNVLAGNRGALQLTGVGFTDGVPVPAVALNTDPCDEFLSDGAGGCDLANPRPGRTGNAVFAANGPSLNQVLTDEQEALLGCGPFYGTDCEADGIDLTNTEASVVMQSFATVEGNDPFWNMGNGLPQPGTVGFAPRAIGTRFVSNQVGTLLIAGSRGPGDADYDSSQDGCVAAGPEGCNAGDPFPQLQPDGSVVPGTRAADARTLAVPTQTFTGAPFAPQTDNLDQPIIDPNTGQPVRGYGASEGQVFQSEMAALSFNMQNLLVAFSSSPDPSQPEKEELDTSAPYSRKVGQCSFLQPQFCTSVISFLDVSGVRRNTIRAGGNGTYGRRDFVWQQGGDAVLRYNKRNVLGFSLDFAEDYTKSNWGMEFTWINGQNFTDVNQFDGISHADTFNLTISVDRPTFVNFLNANRTFFFNSQWFFNYIAGYNRGFPGTGPYNILGTFTVQTGYFQDRLLPGMTFVYHINSASGAILPQLTYRFTENFSATIGANFFWGRFQQVPMSVNALGSGDNENGRLAYQDSVENGLALIRERDEAFLRIRYTF